MNIRHTWIFGLIGLGLAMISPVQAAPNFMDDVIVVAKNDRVDAVRQESKEMRKNREERRENQRESENGDTKGYGYGYERRQKHDSGDNSRNPGRR